MVKSRTLCPVFYFSLLMSRLRAIRLKTVRRAIFKSETNHIISEGIRVDIMHTVADKRAKKVWMLLFFVI